MFVIVYACGGDLRNYLQRNFTEITWNKDIYRSVGFDFNKFDKLFILWQISEGYLYFMYLPYNHIDSLIKLLINYY